MDERFLRATGGLPDDTGQVPETSSAVPAESTGDYGPGYSRTSVFDFNLPPDLSPWSLAGDVDMDGVDVEMVDAGDLFGFNPSSVSSLNPQQPTSTYLEGPTNYKPHYNQSSPVTIKQTIASITFKVLESMTQSLETSSASFSKFPTLQNDFARFKVWVGNNGAHRTGLGSLEYRLHDASGLQQQVLRLLEDLSQAVHAVSVLLVGNTQLKENTDQDMLGAKEMEGDDAEQEWTISEVTDVIDCLLRLDISTKKPTPLDRFVVYSTANEVAEEPDVLVVRAKFDGIDDYLLERLGGAMSRRRHYLKTNQSCHLNLVGGFYLRPCPDETESAEWSTLSNTYGDEGVESDPEPLDVSQDDLEIPSIPTELYKRLFQCPYCLRRVVVDNKDSWERHILEDLRPYNCVAKICMGPEQEFATATEWMQHMSHHHMTVYHYTHGCGDHFNSAAEYRQHLENGVHDYKMVESQVSESIRQGAHITWLEAYSKCPFCLETLTSLEHYSNHVGKHQRELALLAMPRTEYKYLGYSTPAAGLNFGVGKVPLSDNASSTAASSSMWDERSARESTTMTSADSIWGHSSSGWDATSAMSAINLSLGDTDQCSVCLRSLGDARQLRRHLAEVHRSDSDPTYICKCSYQVTRKSNYLRHLSNSCRRRDAPDGVYICICSQPFADFDVHLAHVRDCGKQPAGRQRPLGTISER